jgi:hypothetical protein
MSGKARPFFTPRFRVFEGNGIHLEVFYIKPCYLILSEPSCCFKQAWLRIAQCLEIFTLPKFFLLATYHSHDEFGTQVFKGFPAI